MTDFHTDPKEIAEANRLRAIAARRALATACMQRARTFGLSGKRRDAFANDFFAGAVAALAATQMWDLCERIRLHADVVIAERGFKEIEALADQEEGQ